MKSSYSPLYWVIGLCLIVAVLFGFFRVTATNASEVIPIRLKYGTFDPLSRLPEVPGPLQHSPGEDNGLYLIQFEGPVQPEWKKSVEAAGVRLYDYIPEFTFIASVPEELISRLQSFSYVRWIGPYQPAYRLAESLQNLDISDADPPLELIVVTIPDADLDLLIAWITRQGGIRLYSSQNEFSGFLRVQLPTSALNDLVMQKTVIWVEPYLEPTILNVVASGAIMNVTVGINLATLAGMFASFPFHRQMTRRGLSHWNEVISIPIKAQ